MLVSTAAVALFMLHVEHLADFKKTPVPQSAEKGKSRKARCIPYPPYPQTIICPDLKMYHLQHGKRAFMGDLSKPHDSFPPIPRAGDIAPR